MAPPLKKNPPRYLSKSIVILGVFLISFLALYSFASPSGHLQRIREKILKNPYDFDTRLQLIEAYLENNQFDRAEEELGKAQRCRGTETQECKNAEAQSKKLENLWREKQAKDPKEIEKQILIWKTITNQFPDYRDGYLQLAVLYFKTGQKEKGQESLRKALEVDPNQ